MHRPKKFDPHWIDFFHRPCPCWVARVSTFPHFPLLPKEIQLMIWELARSEPRAVYLGAQIGSRVTDQGVARLTHTLFLVTLPPAILGSNFDGRTAGLKIYRPILGTILRPAGMKIPVYFDLERDYFQMNFSLMDVIQRVFQKAPNEQNELPLIKNLVVEVKTVALRDTHLISICRFFSGLERLYVIEPDFWTTSYGVPHTFQAEEKSFRHDWVKLHRQIQAPIPFVRDRLDVWTPPELTIGTRTEWQFRGPNTHARKQFCERLEKITRGEMEGLQLTSVLPSLEFVPLYKDLKPELTYSISIDPTQPQVPEDTNHDVTVANYFTKRNV